MPTLKVQLLGACQITLDDQPIAAAVGSKARALLFYLIATRRTHERTALSRLLWPEMTLSQARVNLRQALAALQKHLPGQILVNRQTVALDPAAARIVDLDEFEDLLRQSEAKTGALKATTVTTGGVADDEKADMNARQSAMVRYQGDFLAGFFVDHAADYEEWVRKERDRLRARAQRALHVLVADAMQRRAVAQGLEYVERLLALDPWDEQAHRRRMRLLVWDGQRGAALAHYVHCRRLLWEELAVRPEPATTLLYERLQALRTSPPVHLPNTADPFVARPELAIVTRLLRDPACRLLTLTGMVGAGKTRLALAVAAQEALYYLDGVIFVALDEVANTAADAMTGEVIDEADLTAAIMTAVCAVDGNVGREDAMASHDARSVEEHLIEWLRPRDLLLILDGYARPPVDGHSARSDAPGLLTRLLAVAPHIKVLVTTRSRLHHPQERCIRVGGLAYPDDPGNDTKDALSTDQRYPALQLFAQEAQRRRPDFLLVDELDAVVNICRQTGGLPLALKLAAGRIPSQMAQQIADTLTEETRILASRLRNVPTRHRSLNAAFADIWARLTPGQRARLVRLARLDAPFDAATAFASGGDTVSELEVLVDHSLLLPETGDRYALHPLWRRFVAQAGQA